MHALIVEDELLIAFALEAILLDLGFESANLADCEAAARESARRKRPDLITADFQLRRGVGTSTVESIRSELGSIPAIYVTGNPEYLNGIPSGLIATKPFTRDTIRRAWQSALSWETTRT
jgi:DNA-binding response OmpR family regulator